MRDGGEGEKGHLEDFQILATPAGLNWSDLAHWVIYYNAKDPDHTVVKGNTGCRDRLLYLEDRNGRTIWAKRFKVIYNSTNGRIITAYPTSGICTP